MLPPHASRGIRQVRSAHLACHDANKTLTRDAAGILAADLLALRGVKFGTVDGLPSGSWWEKMFVDYPGLNLRTPSPMSFKALTAISVATTDQFFALYGAVKQALHVSDSDTYNMDQTSCMKDKAKASVQVSKTCEKATKVGVRGRKERRSCASRQ